MLAEDYVRTCPSRVRDYFLNPAYLPCYFQLSNFHFDLQDFLFFQFVSHVGSPKII